MERKKGNKFSQMHIEKKQQDVFIEQYLNKLNKAITSGRFDEVPEGMVLVKLGFLNFREKLEQYFGMNLRGNASKTRNFLKLLSDNPDEVAFITLKVIISSIGGRGANLTSTAEKITKKLSDLHFFSRLKKDNPKLLTYLGTEYKRASARRKEELIKKHIKELYAIDFETNISDKKIAIQVGTELIDILINSGVNIIEKRKIRKGIKSTYKLVMTREAANVILNFSDKDILVQGTNMLPMVYPPKDWTSNTSGGYLYHKINLVKTKSKVHKQYIEDNFHNMKDVFRIVNKIQKTPWRVNEDMMEIINEVFYKNIIDPSSPKTLPRCIGNIPSSYNYKAEDLIEKSPGYPDKDLGKKDYEEALKIWGKWNKKRERVKIDLEADGSRRLDLINALSVAKKMVEYSEIYFVFQLDYRGRVYYNNQFLNPQAKGYVKSMLEFSKGRKLDDIGLRWLKIHIANVVGYDKELLEDRIKWFDDNVDDIITVGKNPMENKSLWINTDSPFEYVVAAKAYIKYLNNEEVHLPIQLDATNSGIQFYSGLVRDAEGAATVNVINKYIDNKVVRADIYQDVADIANKKLLVGDYIKSIIFKDSEGEEKTRLTHKEALSLKNKITRSITKKNTMTVAYSVTSRGMMDQNWDTIKKAELENKIFWEGESWVVNKIITDLNERSIFESIKGAKVGQDYLKEVASKLKNNAKWFSPIYNFPVFQPSFTYDERKVNTPLGRLTLKVSADKELNKRKQLSSIAANFIHSLDSSLLMSCIDNATDDIGVIHDCFLVHPNDGEEIRNNYKEGYIKIMESNPLKSFQDGFNLKDEDKVDVPNFGTLNLKDILDSIYILS